MAKRKTEKDHLAEIGEAKFASAKLAALLVVRQDARLIGMDKIREVIAHEAALTATGFPPRSVKLPNSCGKPTQQIFDLIEQLMSKAVEAATPKVAA